MSRFSSMSSTTSSETLDSARPEGGATPRLRRASLVAVVVGAPAGFVAAAVWVTGGAPAAPSAAGAAPAAGSAPGRTSMVPTCAAGGMC